MVKKQIKPIKKTITIEGISDYAGVLLERIEGKIEAVAEGQTAFREEVQGEFKKVWHKFGSLEREMNNGFKEVWGEMGSMKQEMRQGFKEIRSEMGGGFKEIDSRFKTVFEFLSRIDDELVEIKAKLENKVDKKEMVIIEQRMAKLELELTECKRMIELTKKN